MNTSTHPLLRRPTIRATLSFPLSRLISISSSHNRRRHRRRPIPCSQPDNLNNINDNMLDNVDYDYGEDVVDDDDDDYNLNCIYSKPIVVLDIIWNLAFVVVSTIVLFSTLNERPSSPLRVWVSGYAVQCVLHVGFVLFEYRRWCDEEAGIELHHSSVLKRLESVNTMVSSVWWVLGFYWIVAGGQALLQDSPRLYWLTVVFLAFDVFFIVFCVGLACIIFLALFCCIPIVAVAYAFASREGATEDDIRMLPKYRYRRASPSGTLDYDTKQVFWKKLDTDRKNSSNEMALILEDSECCICLSQYVEGVELCSLPCNHHFHSRCISKWLRINATCPLCKSDIRRGDMLV